MHKRNSPSTGFTIVELLIVIVVIAILAAISIVAFTSIQNRAYDSAIQSDLNNFAKQIHIATAETGDFPAGGSYQAAVGSSAGDSTSFPTFRFQPSKQAYFTAADNLYYCTGPDISNGQAIFKIRARSKSGNLFDYVSTSGIQNLGNVAAGHLNDACEEVGYPRTRAYGYRRAVDTWHSWTD